MRKNRLPIWNGCADNRHWTWRGSRSEGEVLKKAWHLLPSVACHALISRMREQMPSCSVRKLCRLVQLNRQWYSQHRCKTNHQEQDQRLCTAVQAIGEAEAFYGYRRVTKALVRCGWKVTHKRVWRVMRQAGLTCRRKRRIVQTTDSKQSSQIDPNLVKGLQVEAPNREWVADLTDVRLPEGEV